MSSQLIEGKIYPQQNEIAGSREFKFQEEHIVLLVLIK